MELGGHSEKLYIEGKMAGLGGLAQTLHWMWATLILVENSRERLSCEQPALPATVGMSALARGAAGWGHAPAPRCAW